MSSSGGGYVEGFSVVMAGYALVHERRRTLVALTVGKEKQTVQIANPLLRFSGCVYVTIFLTVTDFLL